jgi:hypothetical protein
MAGITAFFGMTLNPRAVAWEIVKSDEEMKSAR